VEGLDVDAHSAVEAVAEVVAAAYAAETTVFAVVWMFVVRHPEIADVAVVFSEFHETFDALVGLTGLSRIALSANNFTNRETIDLMMFGFRHTRPTGR